MLLVPVCWAVAFEKAAMIRMSDLSILLSINKIESAHHLCA
jgi:hypothetical protein